MSPKLANLAFGLAAFLGSSRGMAAPAACTGDALKDGACKLPCNECGDLTVVLPDPIPAGTSIEKLDLVAPDGAQTPVFSGKEALPAKLVISLPVKVWKVRSTWRQNDRTAVTDSDAIAPVDAAIAEVDPAVVTLQLPHSDDFSTAPNPPAIHRFTRGLELYGRVDVAPLAPAGGAINVGLALQFSRHFELALAAAASARLLGGWGGVTALLPTTERGRVGVTAGAPMFFANIGDQSIKPPTPLVGLQLGLDYHQGLGDERASCFVEVAAQHYPWLDSEKFHGTLLLLSAGFEYGL